MHTYATKSKWSNDIGLGSHNLITEACFHSAAVYTNFAGSCLQAFVTIPISPLFKFKEFLIYLFPFFFCYCVCNCGFSCVIIHISSQFHAEQKYECTRTQKWAGM